MRRNTEIGAIATWGPQFRVCFDLKINSHVSGNRGGWSNVISFKNNGGKGKLGQIGDRIPAIFLNRRGFLHFTNGVNGNNNYHFNFHSINVNKWYSITIQQTRNNDKAREKVKLHIHMFQERYIYARFTTPSLLMEKKYIVWKTKIPGHSKM